MEGTMSTQPQSRHRYEIVAHYYYYAGAAHAPADGPLRDLDGAVLQWRDLSEARAYLTLLVGPLDAVGHGRLASTATFYYLSHGEYSQPDYEIRRARCRRNTCLYRS